MSIFAVTIEKISKVWNHPNADRLDLAEVQGMTFQFVVLRDEYKAGDVVLYFPVDAVLPEKVIEKLGLTGKLSGGAHNRVKTVKLRGAISQGLVSKIDLWADELNTLLSPALKEGLVPLGADVSEAFGIIKYEAPETFRARPENLLPLPGLVGIYDIEGADRFPEVVSLLMGESVVITEKIEGSHFAASLDKEGSVIICQRRFSIKNDSTDHLWLDVAKKLDLEPVLKYLFAYFEAKQLITLRGELVGPKVQGNYYELKTHDVYFFEIEVDGQPVTAALFLQAIQHCRESLHIDIKTVPSLVFGNLETILFNKSVLKTVQDFSNGQSVLIDKLREGIVIRPLHEEKWISGLGRLILKQRSPEYLAKGEA